MFHKLGYGKYNGFFLGHLSVGSIRAQLLRPLQVYDHRSFRIINSLVWLPFSD